MTDAAMAHELVSAMLAHVRSVQLVTGGPVRNRDVAEFRFRGTRIPLLDPVRGIRKPAGLDFAITIRTVYAPDPTSRPYDDAVGDDGMLRYKWTGQDPDHYENSGLRRSFALGLPMIWFQPIASGLYHPLMPVWLVDEEPASHQFVVALDQLQVDLFNSSLQDKEPLRSYAERSVKERLHQPLFRSQVLDAYDNHCSLCHLRHRELLDAAHIKADADGGPPTVVNGIAMCKIHHAAFDSNIMGIRPGLPQGWLTVRV